MSFNVFQIFVLLLTSSYAVSIDCPNMIQLAFRLGMQSKQPAIWTTLQSDCCTDSDVICASQRVTEILWYSMGLNGVINGTAIPSSVTYLDLSDNVITGSIPSALPSGLVFLYLHGNQMSGDLPSFPGTLQFLYLGYPEYPGNSFTGTLRLNQPSQLYINDNWITDVVIQDSSAFTFCDLSNNPLLGNPNIVELTMCTQDGLYSAALLPVTRSTEATVVWSRSTLTTAAGVVTTVTGATMSDETKTREIATTIITTTVDEASTVRGMMSSTFETNGTLSKTKLRWTKNVGTVQFAPMMQIFTVCSRWYEFS